MDIVVIQICTKALKTLGKCFIKFLQELDFETHKVVSQRKRRHQFNPFTLVSFINDQEIKDL